eukprot:10016545-Lingulodinium_polyedra.AAC.1
MDPQAILRHAVPPSEDNLVDCASLERRTVEGKDLWALVGDPSARARLGRVVTIKKAYAISHEL